MEWNWALAGFCLTLMVLAYVWGANARLDRIERKLRLLLKHHGIDPMQGFELSERVQALARDPASKLAAIKLYRQETGTQLVEAKAVIEAFIERERYGS